MVVLDCETALVDKNAGRSVAFFPGSLDPARVFSPGKLVGAMGNYAVFLDLRTEPVP